jgi:hypothetical protein
MARNKEVWVYKGANHLWPDYVGRWGSAPLTQLVDQLGERSRIPTPSEVDLSEFLNFQIALIFRKNIAA